MTTLTAPIYEFNPIHHQRIVPGQAIILIVPETTIAVGTIDPTIQTSSARKIFMVSSEINRQPSLTDLSFIFNQLLVGSVFPDLWEDGNIQGNSKSSVDYQVSFLKYNILEAVYIVIAHLCYLKRFLLSLNSYP